VILARAGNRTAPCRPGLDAQSSTFLVDATGLPLAVTMTGGYESTGGSPASAASWASVLGQSREAHHLARPLHSPEEGHARPRPTIAAWKSVE
jgi:hypothetical protein